MRTPTRGPVRRTRAGPSSPVGGFCPGAGPRGISVAPPGLMFFNRSRSASRSGCWLRGRSRRSRSRARSLRRHVLPAFVQFAAFLRRHGPEAFLRLPHRACSRGRQLLEALEAFAHVTAFLRRHLLPFLEAATRLPCSSGTSGSSVARPGQVLPAFGREIVPALLHRFEGALFFRAQLFPAPRGVFPGRRQRRHRPQQHQQHQQTKHRHAFIHVQTPLDGARVVRVRYPSWFHSTGPWRSPSCRGIPATRARPPSLSRASCPRLSRSRVRRRQRLTQRERQQQQQRALSRHRRGSPATDRTQARRRTPGSPSTPAVRCPRSRSAARRPGGKPQRADHRDRHQAQRRAAERQPAATRGRRAAGAGTVFRLAWARRRAGAQRWFRRGGWRLRPAGAAPAVPAADRFFLMASALQACRADCAPLRE